MERRRKKTKLVFVYLVSPSLTNNRRINTRERKSGSAEPIKNQTIWDFFKRINAWRYFSCSEPNSNTSFIVDPFLFQKENPQDDFFENEKTQRRATPQSWITLVLVYYKTRQSNCFFSSFCCPFSTSNALQSYRFAVTEIISKLRKWTRTKQTFTQFVFTRKRWNNLLGCTADNEYFYEDTNPKKIIYS